MHIVFMLSFVFGIVAALFLCNVTFYTFTLYLATSYHSSCIWRNDKKNWPCLFPGEEEIFLLVLWACQNPNSLKKKIQFGHINLII
jgi:hypothetical protein